jgi:fatty acid desaturase
MLQRMIEDFKESAGTTMRLTSLAAAAAVGLFITTSFLCAAAFVFVFDRYGLVPACLTGAAIFFVVTLIAALSYMARKREIEKRAAQAAQMTRSAAHSALADPMLVATGLQLVRAIGMKRLLPILAVGGLALGFLASRQSGGDQQAPAE